MRNLSSKSFKAPFLQEGINKEVSENVSKEIKALRHMADKLSTESSKGQQYKVKSIFSELKDERVSESESFQKLKASLTGDAHFAQVTLDRNGKNLELWLPPLTHEEILQSVDFTRTLMISKATIDASMSKEKVVGKEESISVVNVVLNK